MREVPCPACDGARLKPEVARGDAWTASRSPRSARCRSATWPSSCSPWSCPSGTGRSPSGSSRRSTRGWASCSTSAWTTCPWTGPRPRWPAARPSGSGWPPRSAPAWSACSTCWTSRRIGLHQRDNHRLLETLLRLRDLGNTLIVVEHDEDTIRAADWVVDIGPGRRRARRRDRGLRAACDDLLASQRLADRRVPVRAAGRSRCRPAAASASQAASSWSRAPASTTCADVDVAFPLGCLIAVTGVSGSGKSTLVNDILYNALARELQRRADGAGPAHAGHAASSSWTRSSHVDQAPIGRTPRSNPATYTGVFDHIRRAVRGDHRGQDPRLPAGPVLASTSRAAAARPAPATARSRSRCTSCPTCTCRARSATAPGTTPRRWRCTTRARRSPRCWTCRSRRRPSSSRRSRRSHRHLKTLVDVGLGLRPARPAGADPVRRRGAAGQARLRAAAARRPAGRSTCSTSRPPACTSRTSASCSACSAGWSTAATRSS